MPSETPPFSFVRWLLGAVRHFVLRFITVMGGLMAFNYAFGRDDAYKAWALADPYQVAILILACLVAILMYDWAWSEEP